jgi:GNAT superfamily N-acetyltransferase
MAEVRIRPAEAGDAGALAALLTALGHPAEPEEVTERPSQMASSTREEVLVADLDGPVGLVALHLTPRFAEGDWTGQLTAVVVAKDARGRGVGRRLVEAAEPRAAEAGCTVTEISAGRRPERADAHRFYPALGDHDAGEHHVRYQKPLAPASAR